MTLQFAHAYTDPRTLPPSALDLDHVLELALIEPGPKRGDVAVATVGLHHPSLQAPLDELIDDLKRQLPLRSVAHRLGDPRATAARLVVIPGLRQEQPPLKRA